MATRRRSNRNKKKSKRNKRGGNNFLNNSQKIKQTHDKYSEDKQHRRNETYTETPTYYSHNLYWIDLSLIGDAIGAIGSAVWYVGSAVISFVINLGDVVTNMEGGGRKTKRRKHYKKNHKSTRRR